MSWDILIQDLPKTAKTVDEIPDHFEPKSIGKRDDIIKKIIDFEPNVDFSDPTWGVLEANSFSIEFNIGKESDCHSIMLHVRGAADAPKFISGLLNELGIRAVDCGSGDFFEENESKKSFEEWKAFRDRVFAK